MFFIFGTKNIESKFPTNLSKIAFCSKCGQDRNLFAYCTRKFFSLFFIPIFPLEKREDYWKCSVCDASYYMSPVEIKNNITKEVVTCINCNQKISVPVDKDKYHIKCAYCKKYPF